MGEPTKMAVSRGKCKIYPTEDLQFCMRIKVLVIPLAPGEEFEWLGGDTLRNVEVVCAERGLNRMLGMFDNAIKPPTPRPRKATCGEAGGDA